MFVLTADQVGSRDDRDRVPDALAAVEGLTGELIFPIERYAGDEIQMVTRSAATALAIVLRLTRDEHWRVGMGCGETTLPLPRTASEASGAAFIRAREAVETARRRSTRFAFVGPMPGDPHARTHGDVEADGVEALIDLLLSLRSRRSPEGWEVSDLVATGLAQRDIATHLGITPQAVSLRVKASGLRLEQRATPPLVLLLEELDRRHGDQEGNPKP